jgi:hypothetical protein
VAVGPEHGLAPQVRHVVIVGLQAQGWLEPGLWIRIRSGSALIAESGS